MTKRVSRYQSTGFFPLGEPPARRVATAAAVTIKKGDALFWTSGTLTNANITFAATFAGVAAAAAVSGGDVEYYPVDEKTKYIVPVAANTVLVATTHVGTNNDLSACNNLALNDDPTEGYAFQIDDIDITAEAIVANTYGYAIGHFRVIGTQAGNS
jgi:hypothetical protein